MLSALKYLGFCGSVGADHLLPPCCDFPAVQRGLSSPTLRSGCAPVRARLLFADSVWSSWIGLGSRKISGFLLFLYLIKLLPSFPPSLLFLLPLPPPHLNPQTVSDHVMLAGLELAV